MTIEHEQNENICGASKHRQSRNVVTWPNKLVDGIDPDWKQNCINHNLLQSMFVELVRLSRSQAILFFEVIHYQVHKHSIFHQKKRKFGSPQYPQREILNEPNFLALSNYSFWKYKEKRSWMISLFLAPKPVSFNPALN